MADSNRLRLSYVEEAALGTTPATPAMREIAANGETLTFNVEYAELKQLRSDRQTVDTLQVGAKGDGGLPFELTYPGPRCWLRDFLRYALFGTAWAEMPELYNLTGDSVITAVTNSSDTFTVAAGGDAFKARHLARASGFAGSVNNALFRVGSSTGTTVVMAGTPVLADEAAPPAGARLKVVGFEGSANQHVVSATIVDGGSGGTDGTQTVTGTTGEGTKFQASVTIASGIVTAVLAITVAGDYTVNPDDLASEPVTGASLSDAVLAIVMGGDISATSTGLASAVIDFTTLGLGVGQWARIGGDANGQRFATAADNDWGRITAIVAHALTMDNLPAGWAADAGAGKTIRVFVGDTLRNGVAKKGVTIEKGFMDLAPPNYLAYRGMVVAQMSLQVGAKEIVTGSFTFLGMGHAAGTASLDDAPDAAPVYGPVTASANVARLAENGAALSAVNLVKSLSIELQNNLREIDAVGVMGLAGIGVGKFGLTGKLSTYFGSLALYAKYLAGTETSINFRLVKDGNAVLVTIPRVKFEKGTVTAQGENQDVMADIDWRALRDPVTGCTIQIDAVEEGA